MKESLKKEYDALGLPWHTEKASPLDISCEIDGLEMNLFLNQTDSDEVSRFAVKAANSHHLLVEQVERLRELLKVAKCPSCDGSGAYYDAFGAAVQCQWCAEVKQLLKETEPTK